ncbi:hypothetical protein PR048_017526 [Dryococelus australis]|uniref:Uncharacterized protein n=1 Tax=Dryococelus australis TaxID=614101 RepID=A0ABQ9H9R9_9NEOP|nr:hypothetical protein PR048_017526 [Dryococelus australis]
MTQGYNTEICAALNIEVLRADEGEMRQVWSSTIMKGWENRRSPRKPTDQWHCPVRFPHVKIRERPRRKSNPFRLDERDWKAPGVKVSRPRDVSQEDDTAFLLGSRVAWSTRAIHCNKLCGEYEEHIVAEVHQTSSNYLMRTYQDLTLAHMFPLAPIPTLLEQGSGTFNGYVTVRISRSHCMVAGHKVDYWLCNLWDVVTRGNGGTCTVVGWYGWTAAPVVMSGNGC